MSAKSQNDFMIDCRVLPAERVRSLCWSGEKLIDWVSGGISYLMDGTKRDPCISYPYRFDAAITSPSGEYAALYERLGTKAILVGTNREMLREINRSFYHAEVHEYPIHFFRLPDGREALAHCPREYCHLEIEDPLTGVRWSDERTGNLQSFFHSRLASNADGSRLLSAGWVWHPFDTVCVFDLKTSIDGNIELVECGKCCNQGVEISSVAFTPSGHLVVTTAKEAEDFRDDEPSEGLKPGMIGLYDLDQQRCISAAAIEDEAGTIMPVGDSHVVGFFNHPKLVEIATGRVVYRWPDLKTGEQLSSIMWHKPLPPPIALDQVGRRFAVADDRQITVVKLKSLE